jgi:hypothetical protein
MCDGARGDASRRRYFGASLGRFEFAFAASTRNEDRVRVVFDEVVLDTK